MNKFTNFLPKILPIAGYFPKFLTQSSKFSLFFLSPYSYARISNKKLFLIPLLFLLTCCNENSLIKEGEHLFKLLHLGKNNVVGCISCHTTKSDVVTVGPSLSGLALRADKIVKNMSAQEYIRQSVINPDAYIVSGYSPAVMFSHYQEELSEEEIDALVLYLLQLK